VGLCLIYFKLSERTIMERSTCTPPKNPLITPSASPPITRSSHPPPKRQRLTSTPAPSPLSRSSTQTPNSDLHDARRSSSQRVMDTWSGLADRYSKRLDEDDIIDLRAKVLIKDRGILRSTPLEYEFGCFGDAQDASTDDGEEEDDIDELDSFREGAELEVEVSKGGVGVPPVTAMDPADAEDLREFLEAERRRKEECEEEEEAEECSVDLGGLLSDWEADNSSSEDVSTEVEEERDGEESADPVSDEASNYAESFQEYESEDDEFGAWEHDEGNAIYEIPRSSPAHSEEVEIIEAFSPVPHTNSCAKSKIKSKHLDIEAASPPQPSQSFQLHTPPQSSSSLTESTPDDPPGSAFESDSPLSNVTFKGKGKAKRERDAGSRKRKRVPSSSPSMEPNVPGPSAHDQRPNGTRDAMGRRPRRRSNTSIDEVANDDDLSGGLCRVGLFFCDS
jgi:hypothetical protein